MQHQLQAVETCLSAVGREAATAAAVPAHAKDAAAAGQLRDGNMKATPDAALSADAMARLVASALDRHAPGQALQHQVRWLLQWTPAGQVQHFLYEEQAAWNLVLDLHMLPSHFATGQQRRHQQEQLVISCLEHWLATLDGACCPGALGLPAVLQLCASLCAAAMCPPQAAARCRLGCACTCLVAVVLTGAAVLAAPAGVAALAAAATFAAV